MELFPYGENEVRGKKKQNEEQREIKKKIMEEY